jgi:hypothetical protein
MQVEKSLPFDAMNHRRGKDDQGSVGGKSCRL